MKYIITTQNENGEEKHFEVSNKSKTKEELMSQLEAYYTKKGMVITDVKPKHENPFKT